MLKLSNLKIDPEFSAQILPLSFEELQQLGRRNLTPERRKYLIGKRCEAEKRARQAAYFPY